MENNIEEKWNDTGDETKKLSIQACSGMDFLYGHDWKFPKVDVLVSLFYIKTNFINIPRRNILKE